jgi:hypothetical protein
MAPLLFFAGIYAETWIRLRTGVNRPPLLPMQVRFLFHSRFFPLSCLVLSLPPLAVHLVYGSPNSRPSSSYTVLLPLL